MQAFHSSDWIPFGLWVHMKFKNKNESKNVLRMSLTIEYIRMEFETDAIETTPYLREKLVGWISLYVVARAIVDIVADIYEIFFFLKQDTAEYVKFACTDCGGSTSQELYDNKSKLK